MIVSRGIVHDSIVRTSFVASHGPSFVVRTPDAFLALGLRICGWHMSDVLVCWAGVKAWGCPMHICGREFAISGASPLAPGTGLKAEVCKVTWPGHWLAVDMDNWCSVLVPEETGWYLALLRRKDTGRRRSLNSPTRRLLSNRNQLSGRHPYQVSAVPMIADPRDSPLVLSMNEQGRRQEEVRQLITFLE